MSFYSRYQLERLLADGPAKTFRAVENSSGRPVFLHLFNPEGRILFDTITARFRDTTGRLTPPLLETGEFAGSLYAVTEIIEPFVNLSAWVESVATGLASAPAPLPELRPVAGSSTTEPGEFTRMFALQQTGTPPLEIVQPPAEPSAAAAPKEPGAFTREFMVHVPPKPAIEPAAPSQSAWPTEEVKSAAPIVNAPKPAEKPMWPDAQPGSSNDISDLFGPSIPGEQVDVEAEQARAAKAEQPANKPFRRAGTFTKMFGPSAPRKTAAEPDRPKSISSLFDSGLDPFKSNIVTRADSKLDPKIDTSAKTGPGEYTRMMAIPLQAEESAEPPPAQPAIPLTEPRGNRALVIAFVLIGVLAIAVIILVVLLYFRR